MSTRINCAVGTPERGNVLRRRTDGDNSGGTDDSVDSVDEAAAAAAAVLAADRAWHESKDIPYVEVFETFSIGADDSACEFQRTDSRAAECGACGMEFGVYSHNGRALNMHAAACALDQSAFSKRAARAAASAEWSGSAVTISAELNFGSFSSDIPMRCL